MWKFGGTTPQNLAETGPHRKLPSLKPGMNSVPPRLFHLEAQLEKFSLHKILLHHFLRIDLSLSGAYIHNHRERNSSRQVIVLRQT